MLYVALAIFAVTYIGMLTFQKYRPYIALTSALVFILLGVFGALDMSFLDAITAVDYNVLLMIAGTMGIVTLFIESKMPLLMSEKITASVPNVKWAVLVLSLFAGVVSAFVDNVATVLMIAPIGLAISRKLNISPVPVLVSIAVSSNLQGAATLVGDTTSIMLGGAANMNFLDFFWMNGKPGIFFAVELGAVASALIILVLFRKDRQKINVNVETTVEDYFPTVLLLGVVLVLIGLSFVPAPQDNAVLETIYNLRNGIACMLICIIGVVRACIKDKSSGALKNVLKDLDKDTLLLLFGLFIVIKGIESAGVIDAVADLFIKFAGSNPFLLYTLLVFVSVIFSAFVDNIPYVATMLPVVTSIAAGMGAPPEVFYFGLLIGATLGGNLTPIGASANITAIGILRKNGYEVKLKDFLRIGLPFTLAAVLVGYGFIWLFWGVA